jgi:uncharacterized protein (DUF4415 family)
MQFVRIVGDESKRLSNFAKHGIDFARVAEEFDSFGHLHKGLFLARRRRAPTKVAVSIRLSRDIVEAFKAKGPGWQSRIDETLRASLHKKPANLTKGTFPRREIERFADRPKTAFGKTP